MWWSRLLIIWLLMSNGKEWPYKKLNNIFGKLIHVTKDVFYIRPWCNTEFFLVRIYECDREFFCVLIWTLILRCQHMLFCISKNTTYSLVLMTKCQQHTSILHVSLSFFVLMKLMKDKLTDFWQRRRSLSTTYRKVVPLMDCRGAHP